ncbi:MAG: hypothetical protein CM1200mP14_27560 [Gammaproteobacteria bacterium]|nr:MAG: hypothetical protein CM1200mP14_27560 [Gammaproteobacteria bacterium]
MLLNITNDAWYGREPLYSRTTALWQHPAHLVMRAIENRMGIARSANTGISLYVDPIGRVHGETDLFESDIRIDNVLTTTKSPFLLVSEILLEMVRRLLRYAYPSFFDVQQTLCFPGPF